jgi:hypothetical protein
MREFAAQAVLVGAVAAAAWAGKDEAKEPPQIFALEIDGKRVPLELDRPVDLATPAPVTRATLRSEPHRVFDFAGVRFHYPREMGFEADLETPEVAIWTLDGNDAVVMVHRLEGEGDAPATRARVEEGILAQYGRAGRREPAKATLGGRELEGSVIQARIAGSRISQEVFAFPSGKDSIVLILQDSLKDDGGHTDEYGRVRAMLGSTLRFPGAKEGE